MHHHVHVKKQRTRNSRSSRQRGVLKNIFTREQLRIVVSVIRKQIRNPYVQYSIALLLATLLAMLMSGGVYSTPVLDSTALLCIGFC